MLTLEEFNKLPAGLIFRSGIVTNSPTGIFLTRDSNLPFLKYVAIKGYANDFTIYIGRITDSEDYIAKNGDKSNNSNTITLCISCDDEVKKLYRP